MKIKDRFMIKDPTAKHPYGLTIIDDRSEWFPAYKWCSESLGLDHVRFGNKRKYPSDEFKCWFSNDEYRNWFILRWS